MGVVVSGGDVWWCVELHDGTWWWWYVMTCVSVWWSVVICGGVCVVVCGVA